MRKWFRDIVARLAEWSLSKCWPNYKVDWVWQLVAETTGRVEPSSRTYRRDTVLALESPQLRNGASFNSHQIRLLHAAIGLATEAAEILDALKKHLFYGKQLDSVNVIEEAGDARWYMEQLYDAMGTSDELVRHTNAEKLAKRYPKKRFDAGHAINRDLAGERKILESSPTRTGQK